MPSSKKQELDRDTLRRLWGERALEFSDVAANLYWLKDWPLMFPHGRVDHPESRDIVDFCRDLSEQLMEQFGLSLDKHGSCYLALTSGRITAYLRVAPVVLGDSMKDFVDVGFLLYLGEQMLVPLEHVAHVDD